MLDLLSFWIEDSSTQNPKFFYNSSTKSRSNMTLVDTIMSGKILDEQTFS